VSSRREEKAQRRQERVAREQADAAAARRRRRYGIIVGTILGVAALAAIGVVIAAGGGGDDGHGSTGNAEDTFPNAATPPQTQETDLVQAAQAAGCTLKNPSIEGRTHVPDSTKVTYGTTPPTSGNHNPTPAEDGYYAQKPSVRNTVHTLEHGRVYIHYDPTISQKRIAQLGGLFNDDPFHMVLSPDPDMPYAVAVTAWGHLAGCKRVNDATFDVIRAFRDRYRDRGPEAVP
jgi:Protein of unknown function (DUF3105)